MRKNLIVAAVGDESVHPSWLAGGSRTFDVALVYFGDQPGRYADQSDHYVARKGIEFSLLYDVLTNELAAALKLRAACRTGVGSLGSSR